MATKQERNTLHRKVPKKGIYVFYEGRVPVYVGRSNRLSNRILQHGRLEESPTATPVATKIAKDQGVAMGSAKERVRSMKVRVVAIQCPNEQAIFEVYAHVALGHTRYNDFRNR